MKINYSILIILVSLAQVACEEPIELDLEEGEKKLVIDGWITDKPGPYEVRVSMSQAYFESAEPEMVSASLVTITESTGLVDTLREIRPGVYQTNQLRGQANQSYELKVIHDNKTYTANSFLPPINELGGLEYYDTGETNDNGERMYDVRITALDPADEENYYFIKFYINDTLLVLPDELYYVDDVLFNGNEVSEFPLSFNEFESGDSITIEMLSLTEAGFNFFSALDNQLNFAGGPTESPRANLPTNLSGGAIGLFTASSSTALTVFIE